MLPEILDKVSKEKSFNKRVELLKEYESEPLKHVIRGALDPRIKWLVPNTRPPFELNEAPDYEFTGNSLYRETKQFSYFISYNGTIPPKANNLRQVKRETIFIQLLESLYKEYLNSIVDYITITWKKEIGKDKLSGESAVAKREIQKRVKDMWEEYKI